MAEDEIIVELYAVNEVSVYLCSREMRIVNHGWLVGPGVLLQILWNHPHVDFGVHTC